MPVIVLDVPVEAWNEVVIQSVIHGLDICPDIHRKTGNTIVELTGSWDKLNMVFSRIKRKGPEVPELLAVMESKQIDQCQ